MVQRLWIIGSFIILSGGLWLTAMRLTPHKGILRLAEKICIGIILCYVLGLALIPFGLACPQGPLPAVIAGALGFPGAVLSVFIGGGL